VHLLHQFFVNFLCHHQYVDMSHQTFHCHSLISLYSNFRDVINIITLCVILTWRWPLLVGSAVISQFPCPLVGCRFHSLRHVSAHVPSSGSYIRGRVGNLLFTSSSLLPPAPLLQTLRTFELLHSPRAQAVDARQDSCAEEQDGQEQHC
jgi:hypothetical protein